LHSSIGKKDNVFTLSHLQPRNPNGHLNPTPISLFAPNPLHTCASTTMPRELQGGGGADPRSSGVGTPEACDSVCARRGETRPDPDEESGQPELGGALGGPTPPCRHTYTRPCTSALLSEGQLMGLVGGRGWRRCRERRRSPCVTGTRGGGHVTPALHGSGPGIRLGGVLTTGAHERHRRPSSTICIGGKRVWNHLFWITSLILSILHDVYGEPIGDTSTLLQYRRTMHFVHA
jgi:hypothetical protein